MVGRWEKRESRYAEKRKAHKVPVAFSEPCGRVLAALKDARVDDSELADLRHKHDSYLLREFGVGRLSWPAEWRTAL